MATLEEYTDKARMLLSEGFDWEKIRATLEAAGANPELADEATKTVRKERQHINRNKGMVLIALGAALCAFSMFYTMFFGHSYFMLYGITLIGVGIAFGGLVYVMG